MLKEVIPKVHGSVAIYAEFRLLVNTEKLIKQLLAKKHKK